MQHAETAISERSCATGPLMTAGREVQRAIRDLGDWTLRWGEQMIAPEKVLIAMACSADPSHVPDHTERPLASRLYHAPEIERILADHGADADTILRFAKHPCRGELETAICILDYSIHARALALQAAEACRRLDALIGSAEAARAKGIKPREHGRPR